MVVRLFSTHPLCSMTFEQSHDILNWLKVRYEREWRKLGSRTMWADSKLISVHPFMQNGALKALEITHFPDSMVFFSYIIDVSGALRAVEKWRTKHDSPSYSSWLISE